MNSEKLLGKHFFKTTISIRFILLQVCASVFPFVFAVLFTLSFNVLVSYFYDSLNLVAVSTV